MGYENYDDVGAIGKHTGRGQLGKPVKAAPQYLPILRYDLSGSQLLSLVTMARPIPCTAVWLAVTPSLAH